MDNIDKVLGRLETKIDNINRLVEHIEETDRKISKLEIRSEHQHSLIEKLQDKVHDHHNKHFLTFMLLGAIALVASISIWFITWR